MRPLRLSRSVVQHREISITAASRSSHLYVSFHRDCLAPVRNRYVRYAQSSSNTSSSVPPELQKDLPSRRRPKSGTLLDRLHSLADDLINGVTAASQRINKATGTDYTPIEILRKDIKYLEDQVESRHAQVQAAKQALDTAQDSRTTLQKSLLSLLDRKSSWSPTDLDTYTSLIRSEHTHDTSIAAARRTVSETDDALAHARVQLERRERERWAEEQVWSDTIRRNSSWVAVGLWAVNLLVLGAGVLVVEPWRRRRVVGEVVSVLEERDGRRALGMLPVAGPGLGGLRARDAWPTEGGEQRTVASAPDVDVGAAGVGAEISVLVSEAAKNVDGVAGYRNWNWVQTYLQKPVGDEVIHISKTHLSIFALEVLTVGALLGSTILYSVRSE